MTWADDLAAALRWETSLSKPAPLAHGTLRLSASPNRDTTREEVTVEGDLTHGITLCGLRTLVDKLVAKAGRDTVYLTRVVWERGEPDVEKIQLRAERDEAVNLLRSWQDVVKGSQDLVESIRSALRACNAQPATSAAGADDLVVLPRAHWKAVLRAAGMESLGRLVPRDVPPGGQHG